MGYELIIDIDKYGVDIDNISSEEMKETLDQILNKEYNMGDIYYCWECADDESKVRIFNIKPFL